MKNIVNCMRKTYINQFKSVHHLLRKTVCFNIGHCTCRHRMLNYHKQKKKTQNQNITLEIHKCIKCGHKYG